MTNTSAILGSVEQLNLLLGKLLVNSVACQQSPRSLTEVEFKVFSQFGDDGIIQWLINNLEIKHKTFIEFGVEDYRESNTRFLMINNNWSGLVMDGSEDNVLRIRSNDYYWKHELFANCAFIDKENINDLLMAVPFDKEIGLLHIDLDGNDFWIWKQINSISPIIVTLEYNSVFGNERAITVPYDRCFDRTKAHFSNLYFGSSLPALHQLSCQKGYAFIGCNSAGNNSYFVRRDRLNETVKEVTLKDGYVRSKFRESRDESSGLTYLAGEERISAIRGMPVFNVVTGEVECL